MHIAVAKVSLTELLDELKNNHKYNNMRLEKGLKMLIVSSYPPRECGLATFNDIVNAVKNVFGILFPLRYVHYRIMVIQIQSRVTYTYRLLT
jgi:hypothetical protein